MNWLLFNPNEPFTFLQAGFWGFFSFVLLGLWGIEKKVRIRNAFLFAISLFFYWKTSGVFVGILVFSTLCDWFLGLRIHDSSGIRRKQWLALSLSINLGLLLYFKYAFFIADAIQPWLGSQWNPQERLASWSNNHLGTTFRLDQILLPVGISFYTFQTMSYALDVFRKEVEPVRNILDFGFFVSFFPQLVAGPIVRAKSFIPQIHRPYQLSKTEFGMGVFWILNGMLKKVWLADYLAVNLVDRVFANPGSYSGFENFLGLYAYSLQVYADFSGYTDMAIGLALLMGFHLPENFRSPYKARNVGEFWKRWHMSLSSWLKDYLYIPMGGNRGASTFTAISAGFLMGFVLLMLPSAGYRLICLGTCFLLVAVYLGIPKWQVRVSTNINLFMVMLLGGLWHGASWNFIFWGALNGLGLMVYKAWRSVSPWEVKNRAWKAAVGILITFNFITFTRIWFRSGSHVTWSELSNPHEIWTEWFSANTMLIQLSQHFWNSPFLEIVWGYKAVISVMAAGFAIHFIPESLKSKYRQAFATSPKILQVALACLIIGASYIGLSADMQPFIYFQF